MDASSLLDDLDDGTLLALVADGDREAFRVLTARHRAAAWRLLRTRCPTEQAAEDALQETFLAVFRAAGSWQGDGSARAWILGTARNQGARTWRRRVGEPLDPVPLHELGGAAGWGRRYDPEAMTAALEDRARLQAALARLSPADQEVIVLRDLEGLTGPETAEALGIPLNTTKTRLHRARLRLLAALQEDGHAR